MVRREDIEELSYGVVEVFLKEKSCPLDAVVKARGSVLLNSSALANLTKYQDLLAEGASVCMYVSE